MTSKSPHLVEAHTGEVSGWQEKVPGYHNVDGTDYVAWFECDKKRSATASSLWFTLGYRITLQPIQVGRNIDNYAGFDYYYSTYSTPNNKNHAVVPNPVTSAIKKELDIVHNTNRIDTIHGLRQDVLREQYNSLARQYPHLIYREGGQVYAFLQPIIGVANQGKGGYYAVTNSTKYYAQEYRSLGQWKNAKGWANTSTFANHYNKKIPMPVEENVTVVYKMLNGGQAEDGSYYGAGADISSYNAGTVTMGVSKTLGEYGYKSGYNWHSTNMQLVGVMIEQGDWERQYSFSEKAANNLYYDNTTYGIAKCVGLYNTGAYAGRRVTFTPNYSGFADALGSGATFNTNTRGDNITIIYYYGQPASKADFYYQALYYGNPKGQSEPGNLEYLDTKPFNSEFNRSMTDKVKSQISGKRIKNRVGTPVDTIYMPYEFDLTEGSLANSGAKFVGNSKWSGSGKKDLDAPVFGKYENGKCVSKDNMRLFANAVNTYANAVFTSKGQYKNYVFTTKYRSISPVVTLRYFRGLDGSLTLFSAGTPDDFGTILEFPKGETIDVTNLRYRIFGDTQTKAVANAEKYLESKHISLDANSRTANMHLVESYVVDLDSNTSINGWGGATSNCWDSGEMVRGTAYKSDGNGITGTMQPTSERRSAALGEVSGSHQMTAVASGQPMAMVFIYEEAPEIMVKSFVTNQHDRNIDKLYKLYDVKVSEVTINEKTYKTSNRAWHKLEMGKTYTFGQLVALDGSNLTKKENVVSFMNDDGSPYYAKWARDGFIVSGDNEFGFNTKDDFEQVFGGGLNYSDKGWSMMESELSKYVTTSGTSCIDLEKTADLGTYNLILKVFEPDWASVWKVEYLDAEDGARAKGDETKPYSWYKKNYVRLSLPFVGKASVLQDEHPAYVGKENADNVFIKFADEQSVVATKNVNNVLLLSGDYELVNIGVSRKTLTNAELQALVTKNPSYKNYVGNNFNAYVRGFVSDYNKDSNTLTNSSVIASNEYSKEVMTNLEKNTKITWMLNPYANYANGINAQTTRAMEVTPKMVERFYAGLTADQGKVDTASSDLWVWAIYKPKKTVHMGMLYNPKGKDNGTLVDKAAWYGVTDFYSDADGIEDVDLNVYTTEYSFSFPYYITQNQECYEFDKVVAKTFTNDFDVKNDNKALVINDFATAIQKHQSGGKDPNGLDATVWSSVTVETETSHAGVAGELDKGDATYKTVKGKARIQGRHTYLLALYTKRALPDAPPSEEESHTVISYRDTEGLIMAPNSRDALNNESKLWTSGKSSITADDTVESSKDYVPEQSIPTTEFQRTDAIVPKYLVDLDFMRNYYKYTYTNIYDGTITATCTKVDEYGNETTEYYSRFVQENVPASVDIAYYSLEGAAVWSPTDVSINNYSLPDRIWEDANKNGVIDNGEVYEMGETVTMFAEHNELYKNNAPYLDISKEEALLEAPDLSTSESCSYIWLGEVKYDAASIEEAISKAENAMNAVLDVSTESPEDKLPVLRARNTGVTFNNGDGKETVLLDNSNGELVINPSEPIDAPQAEDCAEGVFTSKNKTWKVNPADINNRTKKNAKDTTSPYALIKEDGGYYYQPATDVLQIEAAKRNGLKRSLSSVHYSLVPGKNNQSVYFAGIQYREDGKSTGSSVQMVPDKDYPAGTPEIDKEYHSEVVQSTFDDYDSEAMKRLGEYNAKVKSNGLAISISCNNVIINTPVVVDFTISDESEWDQSIVRGVGTSLVLDRPFTITTSMTGRHCDLPGYTPETGTRDYSKYAQRIKVNGRFEEAEPEKGIPMVQLKFPFQVILQLKDSYVTYPANTWITVGIGERHFLLPSWVTEGDGQLIRARAIACNAIPSKDLNYLEHTEYEANLNTEPVGLGRINKKVDENDADADNKAWNYVAIHDEIANVVGRIYGLEIIDIGDYPVWESTFRDDKGLLNGYSFKSGLQDRNKFELGVGIPDVFPVVSGSNRFANNVGYTKKGYPIRFKLETVGDLDDMNDYVSITPTFAVIPQSGSYVNDDTGAHNVRTDVNVYYNEKVNGADKGLVLVGSQIDDENRHYLNLSTDKFGASIKALDSTSAILGFKSTEDYANKVTAVYTYGNVMLNPYMRTFVGLDHTTLHHRTSKTSEYLNVYDLWGDVDTLRPDEARVESSVQQWYGEYYLPSSAHATYYCDDIVRNSVKSTVSFSEKLLSDTGKYLQVQGVTETNPSGIVKGAPEGYSSSYASYYLFTSNHSFEKAYYSENGDTVTITVYHQDPNDVCGVIQDTITTKIVDSAEEATDLWVKNGFLVVNFSLRTIDGGVEKLIYNTEEVYNKLNNLVESEDSEGAKLDNLCNMWSVEGYVTNKTDDQGVSYGFKHGDFIVYPIGGTPDGNENGSGTGGDDSATDDYKHGGTH